MPSSSRHNFPQLSALELLPALVLLLLLCVVTGSGSPVPVRSAGGEEPSGDEEMGTPPDELSTSPMWGKLIGATALHQKQFEDEFQNSAKYNLLERLPSFPPGCDSSTDFSKESCLKKLVQGLLKYKVLLKHVQKQYPTNPILHDVREYGDLLTSLLKYKMKHPEKVVELSASQEEQLLADLISPNTEYSRKMKAHAILRHERLFLIDGQRFLSMKEIQKERRDARHRPAGRNQPL